jgi:hypothetical protein
MPRSAGIEDAQSSRSRLQYSVEVQMMDLLSDLMVRMNPTTLLVTFPVAFRVIVAFLAMLVVGSNREPLE